MVTSLPMISSPGPSRSAPPSHRASAGNYFSPGGIKHHPLFQTASMMAYKNPTPPRAGGGVRISMPKFSTAFSGSGNYKDCGLGSLKRNDDLKERTKLRKQQSLVER